VSRDAIKVPLRLQERRLLLISFDLLVIVVAVFLSMAIWSVRGDIPFTRTFISAQSHWFLIFAVLWLAAATVTNFYDIRLADDLGSIFSSIGRTSLVVLGGYLLIYYFSDPGAMPRLIALYLAVFTFAGIAGSRALYRRLLAKSPFRRRVIVVGAGWAGQTIAETIEKYLKPHYEVVGFVDEDPAKQGVPHYPPVLGGPADLLALAQRYRAMEVVLAVTNRLTDTTFRAVLDCQECGLQVTPMPVLYEQITGRVPVEHIGDNWYVALPLSHAASGGLYPILKRAFDIAVALVGLAILVALYPLLAIGIKLTSHGPVFYTQERVGKAGRVFRMRKFRSMVVDAEREAAIWADKDDPRVTWVGRFMRPAHLDELPQMLSILKGDMSVVGPRPERPELVAALESEIPFHRLRHAVKPGVTGWAQLSYGYVDSPQAARVRLEYDLYYIKHQSLWLDSLIVARTLGQVIQLRGR
jgi:exopolysaccharide biosynthesis polyprenyl glycosylphosphotransferase